MGCPKLTIKGYQGFENGYLGRGLYLLTSNNTRNLEFVTTPNHASVTPSNGSSSQGQSISFLGVPCCIQSNQIKHVHTVICPKTPFHYVLRPLIIFLESLGL